MTRNWRCAASSRTALAALIATMAGCVANDPRLQRHALTAGAVTSSYDMFVPTKARQPAPVVIALHRFTESGTLMARLTGLNDIAEREGFVVVYPNGQGHRFEAWDNDNRDDVAFVLAIIDDAARRTRVDPRRVYVVGASNGGFLTHRLASLAPETFAAAASVMALMPRALAEQVPDGPPVPMLMIHGTEDRIVPKDATSVFAGAKYSVLPIDETVEYWVRRNRSAPLATRTELADRVPEDGTRAVLYVHAAEPAGAETRYYEIMGGGHTWPGGVERSPRMVVGTTSEDFSASEAIWAFFARHQRD